MEIKYRHLIGDSSAKQKIVKVNTEKCQEILSRLFYALEVYATPKHDYITCTCHGCYLVRVVVGIVGVEILKEVHRD